MIHCLVVSKKREGHCQKENADIYGRMVDTAIQKVIGNIRKLLKLWTREQITVDELSSVRIERESFW